MQLNVGIGMLLLLRKSIHTGCDYGEKLCILLFPFLESHLHGAKTSSGGVILSKRGEILRRNRLSCLAITMSLLSVISTFYLFIMYVLNLLYKCPELS